MTSADACIPNRDDAFWHPFTPMRDYHAGPMVFTGAEGTHYIMPDDRRVLDAMAGLWCVNAGHAQPKIVEAIRDMAGRLDFVSSFRMSHPHAARAAEALTGIAPVGMDHAFFVNSGSEAVDTALKIARAYHQRGAMAGASSLSVVPRPITAWASAACRSRASAGTSAISVGSPPTELKTS